MSFLRRALGGDQPPSWASFMRADEFRAFSEAVRADFARRGLTARVTDDGMVVVEGVEPVTQYGLANLAQLCHAVDRGRWGDAIRTHFENIAAAEATHDRLTDIAFARDTLKVRVYRVSEMPPEALAGMVTTPLTPDLVGILVADLPTTVSTLSRDTVQAWGAPIDELFGLALEHMAAEVPGYDRAAVPVSDGVALEVLSGDSFFVASQVVRFRDIVGPAPNGALVSIPNRHALLWHVIAAAGPAIQAVQALLELGSRLYQEGPGSLTPDLYWWHGGALTLLPASVDDQGIRFAPPDAFVELLNGLG